MRPLCTQELLKGACFLALTFSVFKCYCHAKKIGDPETDSSYSARSLSDDFKTSVTDRQSNYVLVGTLDGRISALDPSNNGKVVWSEETGPGSLLSSTISSIKITYEGQAIRLIPSLSGGLYRFDGESVEPFPITAEALLSKSVKLSDESIINGGNEVRTYGIDPTTGKLKYVCEMSKCMKLESDSEDTDHVLIIKRQTQTVRAINPMTGAEKWNFSVGSNEATIATASCPMADAVHVVQKDDDEIVSVKPDCIPPESDTTSKESNYIIKFIVPDGIVCAVDKYNPSKILWKHKFESPVVNAWELKNKKLETFDLFDGRVIPALNADKTEDEDRPFLYLGLFNKQLYIQEAFRKPQYETLALTGLSSSQLKLPWKPYRASASFKTLLENSKDQARQLLSESAFQTALAVRKESCNIKCGYYLFTDSTPTPAVKEEPTVRNKDNVTIRASADDDLGIMSLWHWWREVLAISLFTSAAIHFLITQQALKRIKARSLRESSNSNPSTQYTNSEPTIFKESVEEDSDEKTDLNQEYKSRFNTDFEMIQCLGKGGFGVVFEAKNAIDDCHYAVKRICLPNNNDARERAMREVKALAKLDHAGIVRYFNAWQECPPPGWQEQQDAKIIDNTGTQTSFESEKNIMTNLTTKPCPDDSRKDAEIVSSNDDTGSFSNFRKNEDKSSSFDVVFEHSNKSTNEATEIGWSSGFVDKKSDPLPSLMSFKDLHWLDQRDVNSQTSSVIFERDSGCENQNESVDEEIRDIVPFDNLFRENRPQSLRLKQQNKQQFLYIQMQLCKKETLKDWMNENNGPRDKLQILDIYDQILSAVQYVHEQERMHRDLKPSNIFFSMDGLVKIGDFGLVTAMTENQTEMIHTPMQEKNVGQNHTDQVGTQLYMSPEQIARKAYDHKVDIFSLGLILFELLVPFTTAMERVKVMSNIKARKFSSDFEKSFPNECKLLQRIISHRPEDRPEAAEIKAELLSMNYDLQLRVAHHVRSSSRTFSTSSNESL